MKQDRLEDVLQDLIHSHCQNCDGAKPLVTFRDKEIISQTKSQLRQVMKEMVPKEKSYHEEQSSMSEIENELLRAWDNGFNSAIQQMHSEIDKQFGEGE